MIISIATGPWLPVPALQGGAIPRLWQGLAEEFASRGHKVRILCRCYQEQPKTEVINGVEYIRQGGFPQSANIVVDLLKDLSYALQIFPQLPTADILIINDFWLPIFAALRPNAGKIVINANRFPKGQYWLYARTSLFAAASNIIQKTIIDQYPAASSRIQVIPNPIDTSIFSPSTHHQVESQEKIILYVGRIHPEKGVHLLLDAFSILSEQTSFAKLRIIGPYKESQGGGGEEYLLRLKSKASDFKVEFVEPIFDIQKLASAYREADIFCYPSLAEKGESFGLAPLEAMASGLMPVVSSLDCFRDFIEDGRTGYFFDHRSHNAAANLAQALNKAIANPDKTYQMSLEAIQKASQFSYQAVADSYLSIFANLVSK